MKLAEGLLLRADMQTRLARVRDRIAKGAVTQEGDEAHEEPEKLIREATGIIRDLEKLVVRINRTNLRAKLPDGRTLMEAVAARDTLKLQHALLTGAIDATRKEPDRYSMREIKWVTRIDVAKTEKQAEDVSSKLRELNARIQETNWKIELEEQA